jgi:hypothetical protein
VNAEDASTSHVPIGSTFLPYTAGRCWSLETELSLIEEFSLPMKALRSQTMMAIDIVCFHHPAIIGCLTRYYEILAAIVNKHKMLLPLLLSQLMEAGKRNKG